MKRAVIVHCWGGTSDYCWYPQTKRDLEAQGFEVAVPQMPDTDIPQLAKWLPMLQQTIGQPDKNLYLIGHSAGCITIMRYLETLTENQTIGGVVFVAGFTDALGFKELKNFFEAPLNFEKIKAKAKHFVAIASNNDPYVPLDRAVTLKEKFGATVITKHNFAHFSGDVSDPNSCISLPDVVTAIKKMV